jgi:hypothetical protein
MAMKGCDDYGKDEMIVNYHDACIFGRDLALLQSPTAWLNDSCIHFYLTFLQHQQQDQQLETTPTSTAPRARGARTLYMDPSVISFLMHQCDDDDDLMDFGQGACQNFCPDIDRLVIPINNHNAASRATWAVSNAGTHWSLLVMILFHPPVATTESVDDDDASCCCLHMDSVQNSGNLNAARVVAGKIWEARQVLMARTSNTASSSTCLLVKPSSNHKKQVHVQECQNVPRQENGHDCGVHVLAAAEAISQIMPDENDLHIIPHDTESIRQKYEMSIQNHFGEVGMKETARYCATVRRRVVETILEGRNNNT